MREKQDVLWVIPDDMNRKFELDYDVQLSIVIVAIFVYREYDVQ